MTTESLAPEHAEKAGRGFLETFYAVLFQPVETFRRIAEHPAEKRVVFDGLLSVLLVSAIAPCVALSSQGGNPVNLLAAIPLSLIGGAFCWAGMALFLGLLSYAFTGKGHVRLFLTLSGLATLPWLLLAPISLLKIGLGPLGLGLYVLLTLLVWLWTVLLFGLALMTSFSMTVERLLIVLFMPFVMSLVVLAWFFGFLGNIAQMTPIR